MKWQAMGTKAGRISALGLDGPGALIRAYPSQTARLRHELVHHPLLGIDALAQASTAMNPAHVEVRVAANRNGEGFPFAAGESQHPAQVIRAIEGSSHWVMLRFVEQLPAFADLLGEMMEQIAPVLRPVTGGPSRMRGFVFISGTGAHTPLHFDPEFNILLQISGTKRFCTLPVDGPWFPLTAHEDFHVSGDNLLPWNEDCTAASQSHLLGPGDALFVPYKSPHWVEVSEGPSISLSLTWASDSSFEQDDAHLCNRWLRSLGFSPAAPAPLPGRNAAKAAAYRIARKLGLG